MSDCLVLRNAILIDGTGAPPRPDAAVVVCGGLIREVEGPAAKTPPGSRTIDLKGRYLLPGLIDAHVHAGNIELKTPLTATLPPAVYVLKACRNLETDLQLGFPTVRDAAGTAPR